MPRALKIGLAALAALILIVGIANRDSDEKTSEAKSSNSATRDFPSADRSTSIAKPETVADAVAPRGSSVRDGKFEFQVLGAFREGATKEDILNTEQARGEFFTVKLRVTNIGDEERTFMSANQKLIVNGNEYEATSFMNSGAWIESINPGLSLEGAVTFDIPKGAVPTAIELHDSAFSGGALLAL